MSKKTGSKRKTKSVQKPPQPEAETSKFDTGWIPLSNAAILVTVISLFMVVLTGSVTIRALGWGEGLLWAVGFGIAVWLVFFIMILVLRRVRRR